MFQETSLTCTAAFRPPSELLQTILPAASTIFRSLTESLSVTKTSAMKRHLLRLDNQWTKSLRMVFLDSVNSSAQVLFSFFRFSLGYSAYASRRGISKHKNENSPK